MHRVIESEIECGGLREEWREDVEGEEAGECLEVRYARRHVEENSQPFYKFNDDRIEGKEKKVGGIFILDRARLGF